VALKYFKNLMKFMKVSKLKISHRITRTLETDRNLVEVEVTAPKLAIFLVSVVAKTLNVVSAAISVKAVTGKSARARRSVS